VSRSWVHRAVRVGGVVAPRLLHGVEYARELFALVIGGWDDFQPRRVAAFECQDDGLGEGGPLRVSVCTARNLGRDMAAGT